MLKNYAARLKGVWKGHVTARAADLLKAANRWKASDRTVEPTGGPMEFWYRHWRGDLSRRRVQPIAIWHGSTEAKPENQWFLRANSLDREDVEDFALLDMLGDQYPGTFSRMSLEESVLTTRDICRDMMRQAAVALRTASWEHPDGRSGLIPIETTQHFCEQLAEAMGTVDLSTVSRKLAENRGRDATAR